AGCTDQAAAGQVATRPAASAAAPGAAPSAAAPPPPASRSPRAALPASPAAAAAQIAHRVDQSRERDRRAVTELSAAVRDQPRDAGWAAPQERRRRASFASSDAARSGLALRQLVCKTSLCELAFDASGAA